MGKAAERCPMGSALWGEIGVEEPGWVLCGGEGADPWDNVPVSLWCFPWMTCATRADPGTSLLFVYPGTSCQHETSLWQ